MGEGDANKGSLHLILNTIPVKHDALVYVQLLTSKGKQVMLGVNPSFVAAAVCTHLTFGTCPMTFSGIGGIPNTQEVMDLCAKHEIYPETKLISANEVNKVYELQDTGNDAGVRYVLDITNSLTEEKFDSINCGQPPK